MSDRESLGRAMSRAITEQVHREIKREMGISELPQGTLTVLFTDVVGSTDLVRDLGDARARGILRRADDVVRTTIRAHDGTEVERRGDSFMVVFTTARRAVECALAVHAALADARMEHPVRVRIGMDTGEVIPEDEGYFGVTVFRASRIADLAGPGEVLASEVTKLLAERFGFEFQDLGDHTLKGLGPGHRLFRLTAPEPAGGPTA